MISPIRRKRHGWGLHFSTEYTHEESLSPSRLNSQARMVVHTWNPSPGRDEGRKARSLRSSPAAWKIKTKITWIQEILSEKIPMERQHLAFAYLEGESNTQRNVLPPRIVEESYRMSESVSI